MKRLKLIWTEAALADLRDISEYIASRNVRAARKLEDAILACADRLTQHPLMYRTGRVSGAREGIVHPNYLIIYRVTENAVIVAAVIHARQQYP